MCMFVQCTLTKHIDNNNECQAIFRQVFTLWILLTVRLNSQLPQSVVCSKVQIMWTYSLFVKYVVAFSSIHLKMVNCDTTKSDDLNYNTIPLTKGQTFPLRCSGNILMKVLPYGVWVLCLTLITRLIRQNYAQTMFTNLSMSQSVWDHLRQIV